MAYVPVPKDLTRVKTKVLFNLTRRQVVCFGSAAVIGLPLYFLLKEPIGNSGAAMCMILAMLPFFMLAIYEKNGRPLEKVLRDIINVSVLRAKQRPYQTNNFYDVLRRQHQLEEEVSRIVSGNQKEAHPAVWGQTAFQTAGKQKSYPGGPKRN